MGRAPVITRIRPAEEVGKVPQPSRYVIEKSGPLDKPAPVITFSMLDSAGKTIEILIPNQNLHQVFQRHSAWQWRRTRPGDRNSPTM
jgi:hypothetical protein